MVQIWFDNFWDVLYAIRDALCVFPAGAGSVPFAPRVADRLVRIVITSMIWCVSICNRCVVVQIDWLLGSSRRMWCVICVISDLIIDQRYLVGESQQGREVRRKLWKDFRNGTVKRYMERTVKGSVKILRNAVCVPETERIMQWNKSYSKVDKYYRTSLSTFKEIPTIFFLKLPF